MTSKIVLGGGCFWCIEAVFARCRGVTGVRSGYAGGARANPVYEMVCTGVTGHAEVIEVSFDDEIIGLADLLRVFFAMHDPTTLNQQGNDRGTQYRSVIFYESEEQRRVAEEVMAEVEREGLYEKPVVTEIAPLRGFYPAEDYHQNYYAKNPQQAYCQLVVSPKVAKFRQKFAHFWRD